MQRKKFLSFTGLSFLSALPVPVADPLWGKEKGLTRYGYKKKKPGFAGLLCYWKLLMFGDKCGSLGGF